MEKWTDTEKSIKKYEDADQLRAQKYFVSEIRSLSSISNPEIAAAALELLFEGTEHSWPKTLSEIDISIIKDLAKMRGVIVPI